MNLAGVICSIPRMNFPAVEIWLFLVSGFCHQRNLRHLWMNRVLVSAGIIHPQITQIMNSRPELETRN
jgi:hypothetical protein